MKVKNESYQKFLDLKSEYERTTDYEKLEGDIRRALQERKRRRVTRRILAWSSSATAVLAMGAVLLWEYTGSPRVQAVKTSVSIAEAPQGEEVQDKVILVMADGKRVNMTEMRQDSMTLGTATVMGEEGRIVYASDRTQTDSLQPEHLEMNRVIIASGGLYSLQLSDGSRVWLNSETEMEYPVLFGRGERVVKLSGEAFFEVAPDAARPFIVEANGIRTRVLGTSFNIKAYRNETNISTTLFTGKVQVSAEADSTRSVLLTPGKQADWNRESGQMRVSKANLEHTLAWKEGLFLFNKENIEVVSRQIERWYGVKFIYETGGKTDYTFNGYFSKDETLVSILEAFTFAGGPVFEIKGEVVYVKNK